MLEKLNNQKPKLVISFVSYSLDSDQNFLHEVQLVDALKQYFDISIIIERGGEKPRLDGVVFVLQKKKQALFRALEHLWIVLKLLQTGNRIFYTRNSLLNGLAVTFLKPLFGARLIFWSCGEVKYFEKPKRLQFRLYFVEILNYIAKRVVFRSCDYLFTGNQTMAEHYAKKLCLDSKKICILPNSIDIKTYRSLSEFAPDGLKGLDFESKIVLFPRSLSVRHGASFLPEILQRILQRHKDARLVICGRGDLTTKLSDDFKVMNLSNYVVFLNGVANWQMPYLYKNASCTIIPSMTEGFPRAILESMAFNTPFVAFDVGGCKEILNEKNEQFLVYPYDVTTFADRVSHFLSTAPNQNSLDNFLERSVRRYDTKIVAKAFSDLIASKALY